MTHTGKINFVLVGSKSVGKTVYLTSLFIDTKYLTAKDPKTIAYLKPRADKMLSGEFPSATEGNLHELKFEYKDDKFNVSLQIDDVDGHFIETLSEKDENSQNERDRFINNLKYSEGIVFFFPFQEHQLEESIKEFSFQIDTIISELKTLYSMQDSIPIPAVIAVSQLDKSPYYKTENERDKVLSYIESHTFLRQAKDKIELNFKHLQIIPLSSTGSNIEKLEPYNIEKPIRFFLEETYNNWVEKIEQLSDDKEGQLIFISKIYIDMKLYDNKKYEKLYSSLESEFSQKILTNFRNMNTIEEFTSFEDSNQHLISALKEESRKNISKIKMKLANKRRNKWIKIILSSIVLLALIVLFGKNKIDERSESELFNNIQTQYKTYNLDLALDDIEKYLMKYKNGNHIQKIKVLKSDILREKTISRAKQIINDPNFNNEDEISKVIEILSTMGITDRELLQSLHLKKKSIVHDKEYIDFQNKLEKQGRFDNAVLYVEKYWLSSFGDDKKSIISKMLNHKFNLMVEQLLKDSSDISDKDEYNYLNKKLNKIVSLLQEGKIDLIGYTPTFNSDNMSEYNKQREVKNSYSKTLKEGNHNSLITFSATSAENEPLGFKCNSEDEIILQIGTSVYHYDNSIGCSNTKMIWRNNKQVFKAGSYTVNVIEEDMFKDDHYDSGNFKLTDDDIIQIDNGQTVKKNIGSGYYIEIEGQ